MLYKYLEVSSFKACIVITDFSLGSLVPNSPKALYCVLEQDTLSYV